MPWANAFIDARLNAMNLPDGAPLSDAEWSDYAARLSELAQDGPPIDVTTMRQMTARMPRLNGTFRATLESLREAKREHDRFVEQYETLTDSDRQALVIALRHLQDEWDDDMREAFEHTLTSPSTIGLPEDLRRRLLISATARAS